MRGTFKVLLILITITATYMFIINLPFIQASFDEDKYVDGEVFTPTDDSYDFRKFTIKSPNTTSYRAFILKSGIRSAG